VRSISYTWWWGEPCLCWEYSVFASHSFSVECQQTQCSDTAALTVQHHHVMSTRKQVATSCADMRAAVRHAMHTCPLHGTSAQSRPACEPPAVSKHVLETCVSFWRLLTSSILIFHLLNCKLTHHLLVPWETLTQIWVLLCFFLPSWEPTWDRRMDGRTDKTRNVAY